VKQVPKLVRLVVALSLLLLAAAVLSQVRLKAARAEIDELASETSTLAAQNEQLREQVASQESVRQRLRVEGKRVLLEGDQAGDASATIHLDDEGKRALLVVQHLRVDASCAYQLRMVQSEGPSLLITFGVDPDGNMELLLDDLPPGIEEFRIERGESSEALLSGRAPTM